MDGSRSLEETQEVCLEAPKADLPSQTSRQYGVSTQTSEIVDSLLTAKTKVLCRFFRYVELLSPETLDTKNQTALTSASSSAQSFAKDTNPEGYNVTLPSNPEPSVLPSISPLVGIVRGSDFCVGK